jgi:hypothetical protein
VSRSEIIRAALAGMRELHRIAPLCPARFSPLANCKNRNRPRSPNAARDPGGNNCYSNSLTSLVHPHRLRKRKESETCQAREDRELRTRSDGKSHRVSLPERRPDRSPRRSGLSESSVEKASKDPRTSLLIKRPKERDEEVLRRCWKKAVAKHREPSGFRRSRSSEGCAQRSASLRDGRRSATDQNGGFHQGSQRRFQAGGITWNAEEFVV